MSLRDRDGEGDELDELVLACLSRFEAEGERAVDEICDAHPELAARVRRRFDLLREAGLAPGAEPREFPEQLGDFRLLERLGSGGMGVVYAAEQLSLGRRVALKLIRPEQLYFPGARARFAREAQSIAKLAHPGIVPVHTVGEASGVPYLAMELIHGASLAAVLARLRDRDPAQLTGAHLRAALREHCGLDATIDESAAMPFVGPWTDACAWIAREVAQALEHAHQRGVVHRDVKPSNVMLTLDGRVLLVDFGLASVEGSLAISRSGSQAGSLPYMAPEQVEGRGGDVGPASDVYGLGVTLFELLALRRPFEEGQIEHVRAAILAGRAPRLARIAPGTPRDLAAVAETAMSVAIEARYAAAADFARDLSHVIAREPIEARPAGPWTRARRWAERNPARALAAVLAGLIVLGGPVGFGFIERHAAARERELGGEISRANAELVASNAELEKKRSDLSAALARESNERERAQTNLGHALDAVDTLLARVGDQTLLHVPQMEPVRRDLLEQSLTFYERFLDESGATPEVRLRNAVTLRKVANLRGELAQRTAAREAATASVGALRALESELPDDSDVRDELLASLAEQAEHFIYLQQFDDAETVLREIIARTTAAIASSPPPADYERRQLALAEQHLAFLLRDSGRPDEAREHAHATVAELRALLELVQDDDVRHRLAGALMTLHSLSPGESVATSEARLLDVIELLRDLLVRQGDHPPFRESLATAYGSLGLLLSRPEIERGYSPRGPSCEDALREAIAINTRLIQEFPLRALFRTNLASESSNLCIHLVRTGRAAEALPFGERAVEEYEALVALEPEVADYHSFLGASLSNVAGVLLEQGDAARALELVDRALGEHRAAIAAEPDNAEFAGQMRQWRVLRTKTLLALGRWSDANLELREFEREQPDAIARTWAAERRADCAVMAAEDVALAQAERDAARDELFDECVARLRELIAGGSNAAVLAANPAFAAMADHAGFRELFELP